MRSGGGAGCGSATTEAIDTFSAPWQILIARLARTASVVAGYATLADALTGTDFRRLDERSLDDWTFQMSVVYGKTLDAGTWAALEGTPGAPSITRFFRSGEEVRLRLTGVRSARVSTSALRACAQRPARCPITGR